VGSSPASSSGGRGLNQGFWAQIRYPNISTRVSQFLQDLLHSAPELSSSPCVLHSFIILPSTYTSQYFMEPEEYVRFEVFTAVTMKNAVFWVATPCGSCKNRRFRGTLHQNGKNRRARNKVISNYQPKHAAKKH
jgi:hypothetical protein